MPFHNNYCRFFIANNATNNSGRGKIRGNWGLLSFHSTQVRVHHRVFFFSSAFSVDKSGLPLFSFLPPPWRLCCQQLRCCAQMMRYKIANRGRGDLRVCHAIIVRQFCGLILIYSQLLHNPQQFVHPGALPNACLKLNFSSLRGRRYCCHLPLGFKEGTRICHTHSPCVPSRSRQLKYMYLIHLARSQEVAYFYFLPGNTFI